MIGLGRQAERVERELREAIEAGALAPGSRLATERELCAQFAVSRTTIRAAIGRLAADGYVTVRQGSGTYVRALAPTALPGSRTISVMLSCSPVELAQAQRRIAELGYLTCIDIRDERWDPAVERQFLERVRDERHKGLLAFCTPTEPRNDALLQEMEASGIRVIHIENYRVEPPDQNFILPDYRKAGYIAAVDYLYAKYQHLYFVKSAGEWPDSVLLRQGFFEAITDYTGYTPSDADIIDLPPSVEEIPERKAKLSALVRALPPSTGLLCNSPCAAEIMLRLLREEGRRCPEDFGIIGVPYIEWMFNTIPGETYDTLDFDRAGILIKAVECIDQAAWPNVREYVAPKLTRRGTVRTV